MGGNGLKAILKVQSSCVVRLWSALQRLPQPLYTLRGCVSVAVILMISACNATIEYVPIIPEVPTELRQPVTVPQRRAETLRDVGLLLADHVQALDTANGRIIATDCILTAAEAGVEPDCI